ncbi:MAG: sigma-70 family RNA polymerase sigma factor [Frankiaceae bacterium]
MTIKSTILSQNEIRALVEEHLPLVQQVLYQVAAHYPRHADREELAQSATLGLVEAAHRFDPSRGVPFARWASVRVRGAIVDAARALDFAPRSLRAASRDVDEALAVLTSELGRTPTAEEIAERLDISVRELHQLQGKVHRALVLSLDAPCGEEDGDTLTLADGLIEVGEADPADQLVNREQAAYVRDALELLPDRLRAVVEGYFLQGRTSAEIAADLGVTESRVSQMRSEALALMRVGLEAQFESARPRVRQSSRNGARADVSAMPASRIKDNRAACRQASYAAALAARSSFAARVSRTVVRGLAATA